MYRLRAKRTTGSNPPAELLFGELAFSDANKRLYVGRADGSPCTFESDLSLSPINDAIAVLNVNSAVQADAIATLTTDLATLDTSQAAQDTAIATLTTTTGDQAAAIAALAPVASSGSYADLTGKPIIPAGFTYDQQGEPVGPAAGATWRERSAGGLIVGEWEWSGSLWLSSERHGTLYSGASASASTAGVMTLYPKYPALLTGYSVSFNQPFSPQDSNNYWTFRHWGVGMAEWLNTINQSTTAPTFLQRILTTPVVITAPNNADNFASKTGAAGNLRNFLAITHYRLIRS